MTSVIERPGLREDVGEAVSALVEMQRNLFRLFDDRTLLIPGRVLALIGVATLGEWHPAAGVSYVQAFATAPRLKDSDEFVLFERARCRMQHQGGAARMGYDLSERVRAWWDARSAPR